MSIKILHSLDYPHRPSINFSICNQAFNFFCPVLSKNCKILKTTDDNIDFVTKDVSLKLYFSEVEMAYNNQSLIRILVQFII